MSYNIIYITFMKYIFITLSILQYIMGLYNFYYLASEGFGIGFLCEDIAVSHLVMPVELTVLTGFLALVSIIFAKLYSEFKGKFKLSLLIGLPLFILPFVIKSIIEHFESQLPC